MATKIEPFALKESDKQSETWRRLRAHLEKRISVLHNTLENTEEGPAAAKVRGQLHEVRVLLALDKDSPPAS